MLQLPNYSEDSLEVKILKAIVQHPQKRYFIAVEFVQIGESFPCEIENFISINSRKRKENKSFKKSFRNDEWHLIFTFIILNKPLDPRFSFTNQLVKLCQKNSNV